MKKKTECDNSEKILVEVNSVDEGASLGKHKDEEKKRVRKAGNIYTDTIESLMEKNRKRVLRYYCANMKCPGTFWGSDLGYECPQCSSLGVISEFKSDNADEGKPGERVLGYLDSIGRIFCRTCAERFGLGDDIDYIIYSTSEPYCHESCEVCRADLTMPF